jgi:fibronectin-binding autotransporter adhesin
MSEKKNCQGGWINRGLLRQIIWLTAGAAISLGGSGRAFAIAPTPAVTWDASGTSDYNTPTNWNPDLTTKPLNSDNQFLTINNGATAEINTDAEGLFLILGLTEGQSGNLVINGNTTSTFGELRVGGRETVPDDYNSATPTYVPNNGGSGTVIQNPGSTVNVTYNAGSEPPAISFYVGDSTGSGATPANGSYTITGTSLAPSVLLSGILSNDAIVIGTGTGTLGSFTQSAFTTVTSTGFVIVGRRGATATYTMNGGILNQQGTTGLQVGDGDSLGISTTSGTFTQAAGTVNLASNLQLGRRNGTGVYTMNSGALNLSAGSIILGGSESGTGAAGLMNGNGTLNLNGGDITITGGNANIGNTSSSVTPTVGTTGLMTMTAGTFTLNGSAAVLAVGNGLNANGTFNQSGGTTTVNPLTTSTSTISIGRNSSTGTYNLSGTGILSCRFINIGAGNGALNISGNSQLTADTVTIDSTSTANTRTMSISGGTVNITNFNNGTTNGIGGLTRSVAITGGTTNVTTLTGGANVTYNISAGTNTFTTANLSGSANNTLPSTFNLPGGTNRINNLTTNTSTLFISGGTNTIASGAFPGILTLSSNSTLRTANTISLASTITMGNVSLDVTNNSFSLTGPITSAAARTLSKIGAGTLNISGTQTHVTGSAITNSAGGGVLNLNANGGPNLAVNANSGTTSFGVAQTLKAIGVNGGTLNLDANASVGALSLAGSPQNYGLTYGSLASSAAIKSNVYFSGTGIVTVGTAGDYNHSGEVEAGDYLIWRKNSAAYGDSAGYNLWRQNFGNVTVPGAGSGLFSGNQTVPEPGTLLLMVVGVLLACGCRRRR